MSNKKLQAIDLLFELTKYPDDYDKTLSTMLNLLKQLTDNRHLLDAIVSFEEKRIDKDQLIEVMVTECPQEAIMFNNIKKIMDEPDTSPDLSERMSVIGVRPKDSQPGKWDGAIIFVSKNKQESFFSGMFVDKKDYISNEIVNKTEVKNIIDKDISEGYILMTLDDIMSVTGIRNAELWDLNN